MCVMCCYDAICVTSAVMTRCVWHDMSIDVYQWSVDVLLSVHAVML